MAVCMSYKESDIFEIILFWNTFIMGYHWTLEDKYFLTFDI